MLIKMVYCVTRHPDVSQAEFQNHWFEVHGPLVKKYASAIKIRRYVQSHTLQSDVNDLLRASKGTVAPYDGIAELWWESWDDFAAAASPEGVEADQILMEDEKRFIDHSRSAVFFTEEHIICDV